MSPRRDPIPSAPATPIPHDRPCECGHPWHRYLACDDNGACSCPPHPHDPGWTEGEVA